MCDYCSCRSRATLDAFGHDHDQVGALGRTLEQALAAGDDASFEDARAELVELLARHGAAEETGLYHELAGIGIGVDHLHDEHAGIDADLRSDDPSVVVAALARLHDHIHVEEYDLFPAAHQLLDDAAWQRLEDHRTGSAVGPAHRAH